MNKIIPYSYVKNILISLRLNHINNKITFNGKMNPQKNNL